jgi:glycosyltransferase involved in cell wall biosynthesis
MKLLMISGDRMLARGKQGAFYATLEELSKHFERIDVITPGVKGPSAKGQVPKFFGNVFVHPSPRRLWYQPWWIAKKGKELIDQCRHDVMTVHEFPPFYNGIGARKLHKKTGIPYALEVHHIVGMPVPADFSEECGRVLSRCYLARDARSAKKVRTVNKCVSDQLMTFGIPSEKIYLVPSFYLDPDLLQPDPSIAKKYDIVSAGRMVQNKGFSVLLDAVRDLPDATLLLIGDGPLRRELEQHAKSIGIINRVTFAGWLPTAEDVMKTLQSGKLFVMNSVSEGGPRIALEAMALGLPVIATRVGVMPDVLHDHHNGVFTRGDRQDLVLKLKELLSRPERAEQMGHEARTITEKFERKTLIKQYADFLQSLAS